MSRDEVILNNNQEARLHARHLREVTREIVSKRQTQRILCRSLRAHGFTLRGIAALAGVSHATVAEWLDD